LQGDLEPASPTVYKNEIRFTPNAKIVMLTNKLPELPADCGGIARRYLCIQQNTPFVKPDEYANYSDEAKAAGLVFQQDPEFVAELRANKEGWIKWLLEGAALYMANPKMSAPASILEYSASARANGDSYSRWLSQNLIVTGFAKDKLAMSDISAAFVTDSGKSSYDTRSKGELAARLQKNPKITTSGNQAKGLLNIHGVVWSVGCNPDLSEDEQQQQIDAFNAWLGTRPRTEALVLEWLTTQ